MLAEDWHDVNSSFIEAIAYDAATKLLSVRLKGGRVYVFDDVPKNNSELENYLAQDFYPPEKKKDLAVFTVK